MPIGGSATEFNITGAKLKVSGGVQVSGSIAYTTDATGFGGVTAQIDGNNTLNVTSGKLTGVTKIERATAATITAITHTNVNNNTTIHIALKNTSTTRGVFITLGTFASDDTVKVNYTDDYMIGPGETGMLTLRKVNGVLSLFAREMFSSKATSFDATDNSPFYIKDGVNYKYPLYKFAASGLTSEVIQGTTYYKPTAGIRTKSRPPKGLPENVTPPSASGFVIGNNAGLTTINYDVLGVSSSFDFGSITDNGGTSHARFLLTDGEASGSFTESGASSGDSYKLFIDKTDTNLTDTVSVVTQSNVTQYIAFHHGAFSASDYSSAYSTVEAAATAGHVYSDTSTTPTYTWGTLGTISSTSTNTTYTWTPSSAITGSDVLMVAGGGGGGKQVGGGGGAGGLLHHTNQTLSGQKTIVVGNGGIGGDYSHNITAVNGNNTTFTGLTPDAIGGGKGGSYSSMAASSGGSGGGGSGDSTSGYSGTSGQGNAGGNGRHSSWAGGGGGGAGAAGDSSPNNNVGGAGGAGLDKSSVFGTTYGDSGWFAGGGGGCSSSENTPGAGGQGGGGQGGNNASNAAGVREKGMSHTGGGGGGTRDGNTGQTTPEGVPTNDGGNGGSGIVLIKFTGDLSTGKKIPKVKDIVLDPTNESNVLISTQGTGISTVTYSVNGGSEVSTPVSQLSVAHGLAVNVTGTLLAYALNASSARLGVKLSKSITTVYGYEIITLLTKSGSQTITYVDNGTTNVTNTYKSAGGDSWNGGWYMDTGYTAPVTFEYKTSASNSDDGQSYKQIGISDSIITSDIGNGGAMDIYHYAYFGSGFRIQGNDVTDETVATAWNSTDTFYIVYKTNGDVEWWQAGTKFRTMTWGTGKTVYLSTTIWKQGNGSDNGSFKNIRIKRRQWDGTKYIN